MPDLQVIVGTVGGILLGLGAIWYGLRVIRASRSYVPLAPGPAPQSLSSRLEARMQPRRPSSQLDLRLTGLALITLGFGPIGYAISSLRYRGAHPMTVPPSAPLLDKLMWIIWLLTLASFCTTILLAVAKVWVGYVDSRRARRDVAGSS